MSTLIVVEHDNKKINPSIYSMITAALQFDNQITLLVAGYQCALVAKEAAEIQNVQKVWLADAFCYQNQLAENMSQLSTEMAGSLSVILAASSTFVKNILPRVAVARIVNTVFSSNTLTVSTALPA